MLGLVGLQLLAMSWVGNFRWRCQQSLLDRPSFIIDRVIEPTEAAKATIGPLQFSAEASTSLPTAATC